MLPAQPERLLVVEDDDNQPGKLSKSLARRGYRVDTAGDGPVAIEKLRHANYDLVLLDRSGPCESTLDLLRLLRATHSRADLPVIMVAGAGETQAVVEALHGGANDYVVKPVDLPVVTARIEAQLAQSKPRPARRRPHRRRANRAAEPAVREFDPLTGIATRTAIVERLRELAARRDAAQAMLTLLVLDLDGFKVINDSFGESTGDRILTEVARRIRSTVSHCMHVHVARVGGDEFAVLAEGNCDSAKVAKNILEAVVRPMVIGELQIAASASIGIYTGQAGQFTPEDLLRNAHLAMYRAKELGKNRWHRFEPELRTRARARMALFHDLRYAVERHELHAWYQPKVNLRTRRIVGFEALVRWRHPERGIVYPGEFIEAAEQTGLIVPIGERMLREACLQLLAWQKRFPDPRLTMNVNLSVKQLVDPNLVERVGTILQETGVAPESLNLELTETALMTNIETARSALRGLRNLRVGLKLDDFGTGYSSLGYLRSMHFDSLKIDKSFVTRMTSDSECRAIVESIARLAQALDMTIVAEGVEFEEQIEELLRLRCETAQGFYFSPAVEPPEAEQLLAASLKSPIFAQSRFRS